MTFTHPCFRTYTMEEIPLDRDLYLMDERWLAEWEAAVIAYDEGNRAADWYNIGYISRISAKAIHPSGIDLIWFLNVFDRWHELKIFLPRDAFVTAALAKDYDKRPTIFVKSEWGDQLHSRANSIFALVDAADMTKALQSGSIDQKCLLLLRDRIDEVAERHHEMSFISFADSLLIKTNWVAGDFTKGVKNNYKPEAMLEVFQELRAVYRETLKLGIYCVIAQGANEYDDALLHRSVSGNHISLNSLGLPFAQIMAIESAARAAIKANRHPRCELYMDRDFYFSLRVADRDTTPHGYYKAKMTTDEGAYYYAACDDILRRIRPPMISR